MCAAWSMSMSLPSSLIGLCGLALSLIALASNQASAQLTTNYLGCAVDSSSSRILANQGPQSLSTVESCAAFAVRNFYQYFGVEFGGQCYFGGSISSAVPSNNCNIPCAANPSEICGGANAISLYSVNPPPATVAYTSYLGCLTDSTSRILNQQGPQNDATVQSCAALAISHSVPYFGLEFGGQCWYGSSILRNVSSSACLLACTGNPNQRCGGANAIDVYQVNPVLVSVPYSTYAGCYADGALSFSGPQSGSTPEACALLAARNGAQYFGLENGGECFYGSLTTSSTSSSCNLACTAAPTERCGGSSALDVWQLSF